jgi:hypothetical protein
MPKMTKVPKMPKIMDVNHLINKESRLKLIYCHPGSSNQKPASSDQHRVSSIQHRASSIQYRQTLTASALAQACPPASKGEAVGLEI